MQNETFIDISLLSNHFQQLLLEISLFTEGNLINFEKLETFSETIDYNPSTEIFSFLFVLINDR